MIPSDPFILLSFINTKLRDDYEDLDELCRSLDLDKSDLVRKLASVGFEYDPGNNQFKPSDL